VPETPRYRHTFARLLGYLRPYKGSLAVSIVLAVASQAAAIALIWLTKNVIDDALEVHDHNKLWLYVAAVAG
jgi:ABC-type multidrug transport system fused ATPase/permease subunit